MTAARNAEVRALLATDAVDFYTVNAGDPVVSKYRKQIEETVAQQLKRGNLISRNDAWHWLRGGPLHEELSKDTLTAHEAKIKAAQEASAAGPSSAPVRFAKPFDEMKTDELGEALKGMTF